MGLVFPAYELLSPTALRTDLPGIPLGSIHPSRALTRPFTRHPCGARAEVQNLRGLSSKWPEALQASASPHKIATRDKDVGEVANTAFIPWPLTGSWPFLWPSLLTKRDWL